jgi:hypothetical protein
MKVLTGIFRQDFKTLEVRGDFQVGGCHHLRFPLTALMTFCCTEIVSRRLTAKLREGRAINFEVVADFPFQRWLQPPSWA